MMPGKKEKVTTHTPPLSDKLEELVEHVTLHHKIGLFCFVQIKNFSTILTAYGHQKAEAVIDEIMQLLYRALPKGSIIEHSALDQMSIVIHPLATTEEIAPIIQKIYSTCQAYHGGTDDDPIHVSTVIGSVDFPGQARHAKEILDHAYIALKQTATLLSHYHYHYNQAVFKPDIARNHLMLTRHMMNAIRDKNLRLAYQPIISSSTGKVQYYECLLRLIDQHGGVRSVGPLIPVMESMGLIDQIDTLVLEMVVDELRHNSEVQLSFNISSMTIDNQAWLQKAQRVLSDNSVSERLIIEITETAMQRDLRQTMHFVTDLQELGCQVALDDFGSGYTSFRQLRTLPIDIVKIDGAYIKDIIDNPDSRMFVKTLIDFTHGFGLKSVAEFVENGEIAKLLMEFNVDFFQGNYFCPALNYRAWNPVEHIS
jgi:EAL domain-containing protein (putative c-di-GMP-specific phosphodiesterase class I)/GGDEF domain-containing protein